MPDEKNNLEKIADKYKDILKKNMAEQKENEKRRALEDRINAINEDKKVTIVNKKGEEVRIDPLNAAIHAANKALNKDLVSYEDYRSAMMAAFNMMNYVLKVVDKAIAQGLSTIYDNMRDENGEPKDLPLPRLLAGVAMSDDGKLTISPLAIDDVTKNNWDVTVLDPAFKETVHEWLAVNGYTPKDGEEGKFKNKEDLPLDKKTFDGLKEELFKELNQIKGLKFRPSDDYMKSLVSATTSVPKP